MEKKSYTQILEILKEKLESVSIFAFGEFTGSNLGLGEIKKVDEYGGEGQGETWFTVKHFVDHDVYIRVDGFYSSYDGTEFYDGWDCCGEVKPQQKTITVYE